MATNFPNGLLSYGVPVLPGAPLTTGKYVFVSSGSGNSGASGKTPDEAVSTIDAAVGLCTANKGDVIVVMPGHTETVTAAAGLDLDVAGITIVGLGSGSLRPTVNFTTATTADMDVDAANVTLINILFTGGVDALAGPIDINAADCALIDCEYRDVTGQATDVILADANADRLRLVRWVHRGATAAGADSAVQLVGCDDVLIESPYIDGNFAVACIENVTTACLNLTIHGSADKPAYLRTRNTADILIALVATTTGNLGPVLYGRLQDDAANITEAISVDNDMQAFDPIAISNADSERGLQWNHTASADA
jgi:hypothetical protein